MGSANLDLVRSIYAVWDPIQETFDRGLAELSAYVEAHGDARVRRGHSTPSGFKLASWCGNRRSDRKAGRLDVERVSALDALGFVWDPYHDAFDRGLAELAACVEANGDARIPIGYSTPSGFKLGDWCNNRRAEGKAGTLDADHVAALDALGFLWDLRQVNFDRGLAELSAYVHVHGNARVPTHHRTPSGIWLGNWCAVRRKEAAAGSLSVERVAALNTLGFVWDPRQDAMDRGLAELAAYVQAHGDARVPSDNTTSDGFKLGRWCVKQRQGYKAGTLSPERVTKLNALKFVWDSDQEAFDRGLGEFAAYVRAHGDARLLKGHSTPSGFKLASWCSNRRSDRKAGNLVPERIAALDALGFVWDPYHDAFDRGLAELAAYVRAHGDALVVQTYVTPSAFKLGGWCSNHRTKRKAGTLSAERIAALDALGFVWDPRQAGSDREPDRVRSGAR